MDNRFVGFIFLFLLVNLIIPSSSVFADEQGVIITELMVNPEKVDDSEGEWIEVFNSSQKEISLSNWTINDDGKKDRKPMSGTYILSSKTYAVICRNADSEKNGGVKCDYESKMVLSNKDRTVILKNSDGNIIDQITYTKEHVEKENKGKSINVSMDTSKTLFIERTYTYGAGDFGTPGKDSFNRINISSQGFNPSTFFSSGAFSLPEGITDEKNTSSITVNEKMIISASMEGGSHSVDLPSGVLITRSNEGSIDSTKLSIDGIETSSLSGFDSGIDVKKAMHWGIANMELEFSEPISLSIFLGEDLNGQVLNVVRSTTGNSNWITDGIVSPGTCTVSSGLCTFRATRASYFAATQIVPTPVSSNSSSSNGSGNNDSSSNNEAKESACDDAKPSSVPTLLSAISGINSVTLNWNKALDTVTHYLLTYGRESGVSEFGNLNIGTKDSASYTVNNLSNGTRYYFRIAAVNNCKVGDFSNETSAVPTGVFASNSPLETLGVASDQEVSKANPSDGEQDSNNASPNEVSEANLFTPIFNFFGAIFSFFGRLLSS